MGNHSTIAAVMSDASSVCSVRDCGRDTHAKGLCKMHYRQLRRDVVRGGPGSESVSRWCSVNGCERPAEARGMCLMHYRRWLAGTDVFRPHRRADRFQVAQEAWHRFADAESDEEFAAAKADLEKAMVSFADWVRGQAHRRRMEARSVAP